MQDRRRAPVTSTSRLGFAAAAACVVLIDQAAKSIALAVLVPGERVGVLGPAFGLELVRNSGGVFGLFPGRGILFFFLTVAVVGAVVIWAIRTGESPIQLGMVAGGGIGNLVDRVVRGTFPGPVVDFLDVWGWPTFNLADTAITLGIGLLVLRSIRRRPS